MDFTIEELSMNAWPSLQTILLDGWVIRMANGYTKRANSINPIYNFDKNIEEKIIYCEELFQRNKLPVVYKILECKEQEIIDKKLEELGYAKIDVTSIQICNEIKQIDSHSDNITVEENFSEDWKKCFYECNNIADNEKITTIETMLENIRHKKICIHKTEKEKYIGNGYGIIEKDFVGIFDIIVKKEFRGKGYGKEIVKTILAKAYEAGIEKAYLQVMMNNSVALELYKNLGFKEIYKYWYRMKNVPYFA